MNNINTGDEDIYYVNYKSRSGNEDVYISKDLGEENAEKSINFG